MTYMLLLFFSGLLDVLMSLFLVSFHVCELQISRTHRLLMGHTLVLGLGEPNLD